jgi:hypothetical protein
MNSKHLERIDRGLIEVWNFPGVAEESLENLSENSQWPSRELQIILLYLLFN